MGRIKAGLMLMTPVQLGRQDTELVVSHKILFQVYEQRSRMFLGPRSNTLAGNHQNSYGIVLAGRNMHIL
jgi:hypothetical protein